ncbi:hypothetical protein AAHA92_23150 [Salvia divinorum]|uniref:Uncharacterized protein n=1 Tax=Salvia divinorum TaxID=28513 RepID=A0ABD1GRC4_SALDI
MLNHSPLHQERLHLLSPAAPGYPPAVVATPASLRRRPITVLRHQILPAVPYISASTCKEPPLLQLIEV